VIPLRSDIKRKSFPIINWLLVLVNCAVFLHVLRLGVPSVQQHFINRWSLVSAQFWADPARAWPTLLTATFLHAGWLHLIFNMIFLIIFGNAVEDALGHLRYLVFYLVAGIVANATQAYVSPHFSLPMLGASGAIAGVLGSFFFLYPHAKILTLIPFFVFLTIREVPAFLFLGLWFIVQMFNGTAMLSSQLVTKQSMGGVAWWAHAGGFVSGLLLTPLFSKKVGRR